MKKRGLEFGFNWLFAILVGAVILFLAIFIATKFVDTNRKVSDTFVSAELSNLLNPIETNLEDSKYVKIRFVQETRVFNDCFENGNFGRQEISTASKIGVGDEWGTQSNPKSSFNKYVFSENFEEGKEMNVIVKPFEMPFKVGDAIFMYSKDYCFINPPRDIEEEIEDLSAGGNIGINISSRVSSCPDESVKVCFDLIGCDINVNSNAKIISKQGSDLHYTDSLIYGAIFSEPEIYECQIKRLMKRASELSYVYAEKAKFLEDSGCSNSLEQDLRSFASAVLIESSNELQRIEGNSDILKDKNDKITKCGVF
ncbi:MAG: hypothetical protein Q8P57_04990 [Candidatus Pacearchaeota archaeon]|nr:hypothetical protein [Candidatus Pacearchaeota archaeon]